MKMLLIVLAIFLFAASASCAGWKFYTIAQPATSGTAGTGEGELLLDPKGSLYAKIKA